MYAAVSSTTRDSGDLRGPLLRPPSRSPLWRNTGDADLLQAGYAIPRRVESGGFVFRCCLLDLRQQARVSGAASTLDKLNSLFMIEAPLTRFGEDLDGAPNPLLLSTDVEEIHRSPDLLSSRRFLHAANLRPSNFGARHCRRCHSPLRNQPCLISCGRWCRT